MAVAPRGGRPSKNVRRGNRVAGKILSFGERRTTTASHRCERCEFAENYVSFDSRGGRTNEKASTSEGGGVEK